MAQIWMETRVQVDGQQVVVVLGVLRAERVHCVVQASHCIHKGGQWSIQHFEKWISHRIFAWATERQVLQNVSHAGTVCGSSAEGNRENIVSIFSRNMQVFRSVHCVTQSYCSKTKFRNWLHWFHTIIVYQITNFEFVRWHGRQCLRFRCHRIQGTTLMNIDTILQPFPLRTNSNQFRGFCFAVTRSVRPAYCRWQKPVNISKQGLINWIPVNWYILSRRLANRPYSMHVHNFNWNS